MIFRMREIPDGWTNANLAMHDKFAVSFVKKVIKLATTIIFKKIVFPK